MNLKKLLSNYFRSHIECVKHDIKNIKKWQILIFFIWFVLYVGSAILMPSKKDFPKREAFLYENIPSICLYGEGVKLKEKLKVYTMNVTPCAEGSFLEKRTEEEILNYYEKELSKFGWEKFVLNDDQHFYKPANRRVKGYKNYNYSNDIEVWIYFDNIKNENEKTYYKISFDGRFLFVPNS